MEYENSVRHADFLVTFRAQGKAEPGWMVENALLADSR